MPFQITPITAPLDTTNALQMRADKNPGFPCRITLEDTPIGEEVLLVHYTHQPANTPFHASHAIYIRPNAIPATPQPDEVPGMLAKRILSLRAFDKHDMLCDADLAEGNQIAPTIDRLFSNDEVAYIHLHFAKPGCYAARADRIAA